MRNPFVPIARFFALSRHRSKVSTSITPLKQCASVAVFMDGSENGVQACVDDVFRFFETAGKPCRIFVVNQGETPLVLERCEVLNRKNIKWFGRPKRNRKSPVVDGSEQLFINLAGPLCYPAYYSMLCSRAKFKIGIYPSAHPDTLITGTDGYSQRQIFDQIASILKSII